MLKKPTSFFLVTLIIGLMYGCGGSSNPFIDEVKNNLKSNNLTGALAAAERSIQNRPGDPLGYYYKAVALGDLATEKPVTERADQYREMNASFATAKQIADTSSAEKKPAEISRISNAKYNLWGSEFNKGIEYATNDSVMNSVSEPQKYAVEHLKNATVIIPDSVRSWDILAQLAYGANMVDLAIEAKEAAFERTEKPSAQDYSVLAAYYVNNGNMEKAVTTLENGLEKYPGNVDITTTLADAYQRTGESQKSINIVKDLVDQDPDNIAYRLNLGSQIYQSALKLSETASNNYDRIFELEQQLNNTSGAEKEQIQAQIDSLNSENEQLLAEYEQMTEEAVQELEVVLEQDPENANGNNVLGVIYQNKAASLFDQRNNTADNEKAAELDKQAREFLKNAMGYYEQAAETDPDNKSYWESLFNIYTNLGMDEKADEAMKKAGIDQ